MKTIRVLGMLLIAVLISATLVVFTRFIKRGKEDHIEVKKQQETYKEVGVPDENGVVWSADHETGDLSQWKAGNRFKTTEADSGQCSRPPDGVSTEYAHSGRYSMKLTINSKRTAGCRQFRKPEPVSGKPYYYSAWFFIPKPVQVNGWWQLFQFKSTTDSGLSGVFWKLQVINDGEFMRIVPVWKGVVSGPHEGDGIRRRLYEQTLAAIPVAQWFHLEVYLKQSETYDGQIIVWQDGVEILNEKNVKTKFEKGIQAWAVNNYGYRLKPSPNTLYIDDVVISTKRIGPGFALSN
jgi:hypothetical protein